VAGPSRLQPPPAQINGIKRKSSTLHHAPRTSGERKSATHTVEGIQGGGEVWMDVGESVMEALEADLQKAITERVSSMIHSTRVKLMKVGNPITTTL